MPNWSPVSYISYKGTTVLWTTGNQTALLLYSGESITFSDYYANCNHTEGSLSTICQEIVIDVNNVNPPNMYGKDLNMVWLIRENGAYRIVPRGANNDGYDCIPGGTISNQVGGCAPYALKGEMP